MLSSTGEGGYSDWYWPDEALEMYVSLLFNQIFFGEGCNERWSLLSVTMPSG